ncbi:MAG TPA: alpha-amylase family glycosyl hydrolase [Candidatus Angelobacter sp.]|jgi:alpha-glucosidase
MFNGPSANRLLPIYNADRPEIQEFVAAMRTVLDAYPERVFIGEIYLSVKQLVSFYGKDLRGANLPFNFQLILCAWNAETIAQIIRDYEAALPKGAWPNWVLGNHDQARIASRIGKEQARVAAMLLLTLRGTPTIYYGKEIGMVNVPVPSGEVQDPAEKNEPGLGLGRDPERSPMPWDNSPHAGFTQAKPWLPLGVDHTQLNVASLSLQSDSILNLYRRLIRLRRKNEVMISGGIENIKAEGSVLSYDRRDDTQHFVILLNLGHEPQESVFGKGQIVTSTFLDRAKEFISGKVSLRPAEGLIVAGEI